MIACPCEAKSFAEWFVSEVLSFIGARKFGVCVLWKSVTSHLDSVGMELTYVTIFSKAAVDNCCLLVADVWKNNPQDSVILVTKVAAPKGPIYTPP